MSAKSNPPKTETSLGDRAGDVYDSARERAIDAYDGARERAAEASRKAGDQLAESPLIALAGGIAAGALIAALLPISRRERELLAPVTDGLKDKATAAAGAAREAGQTRLGELGLTREAGGNTLRSIIDGASDAIKASAQAAASTVRRDS